MLVTITAAWAGHSLFPVGIGSSFRLYCVRYSLIGPGCALLIISIVLIARQPGLPGGGAP